MADTRRARIRTTDGKTQLSSVTTEFHDGEVYTYQTITGKTRLHKADANHARIKLFNGEGGYREIRDKQRYPIEHTPHVYDFDNDGNPVDAKMPVYVDVPDGDSRKRKVKRTRVERREIPIGINLLHAPTTSHGIAHESRAKTVYECNLITESGMIQHNGTADSIAALNPIAVVRVSKLGRILPDGSFESLAQQKANESYLVRGLVCTRHYRQITLERVAGKAKIFCDFHHYQHKPKDIIAIDEQALFSIMQDMTQADIDDVSHDDMETIMQAAEVYRRYQDVNE